MSLQIPLLVTMLIVGSVLKDYAIDTIVDTTACFYDYKPPHTYIVKFYYITSETHSEILTYEDQTVDNRWSGWATGMKRKMILRSGPAGYILVPLKPGEPNAK